MHHQIFFFFFFFFFFGGGGGGGGAMPIYIYIYTVRLVLLPPTSRLTTFTATELKEQRQHAHTAGAGPAVSGFEDAST